MIVQRILAVVDEFPSGTRAVQAAAAIAAAARAELGVMRLIDDPWPFIEPGEVETKRALRGDAWHIVATERVGDEIRSMTAGLPVAASSVTPMVRFGPPALEIPGAIAAGRADLVVLGAATTEIIDAIVLRAGVPCLIVPPEWHGWGRTVVWGPVYREAFAFAALFHSDVIVVDAEPQLAYAAAESGGAETEARKAFAEWATLPGIGALDLVVRHGGDPVTEAFDVARTERADVLVMAYPGDEGAGVAAQQACCAVLLMPV